MHTECTRRVAACTQGGALRALGTARCVHSGRCIARTQGGRGEASGEAVSSSLRRVPPWMHAVFSIVLSIEAWSVALGPCVLRRLSLKQFVGQSGLCDQR